MNPEDSNYLTVGYLEFPISKPGYMKNEIQNSSLFLVRHALFLMSKVHEAPELPPIPTSIDPTPPRPRPPVPRAAKHFIADAPSPRLSSTATFSRSRVVRRDVIVMSKEAKQIFFIVLMNYKRRNSRSSYHCILEGQNSF